MNAGIRLQRFLAQAGVSSRRAGEALIQSGRVTVNGKPVTELGVRVDPQRDAVKLDGERLRPAKIEVLVLHKPVGCVTTRDDPKRRATVMDLLPPSYRHLHPVGRLDFDVDGVLLLTNDGDLTFKLTHPKFGVARDYRAKVAGIPDDAAMERLARGVRLRDGSFGRAEARLQGRGKKNAILFLRVREGKTGEVKDLCLGIGHRCMRLTRIAYGPVRLNDMAPGTFRRLSHTEIEALRAVSKP